EGERRAVPPHRAGRRDDCPHHASKAPGKEWRDPLHDVVLGLAPGREPFGTALAHHCAEANERRHLVRIAAYGARKLLEPPHVWIGPDIEQRALLLQAP